MKDIEVKDREVIWPENIPLPLCDFNCGEVAKYDGKTQMGPWAYMCEKCHEQHGVGLGLGKGQRLIKKGNMGDKDE